MLTKRFCSFSVGTVSPMRTLRLIAALVMAASVSVLLDMSRAEARYSSIVTDADTGQVLYARHADTQRYPASLTKMMTLYLTFDALNAGKLKLNQRLPVSKRAQGMPPSKLGLKAGETITVKDAVLALVTKSANDAAVVIAEALGGTEIDFAKMMTAKAHKLGMTKTKFRNASGLHNRYQVSTARDMARLASALLNNHPKYYHYFATSQFSYRGRSYRNHNSLLRNYEGTDGIKTGYIRTSGFNLVASAKRSGRRVIGVVFGGRSSRTRDAHMRALLDRGFKSLRRAVLISLAPPRRNPLRGGSNTSLAQAISKPAAKPSPAPSTTSEIAENLTLDDEIASVLGEGDITPASESLSARIVDVWGVQVGAFSNYAPARLAATQAARRLPDILLETRPFIESVDQNTGELYRAQLMGLTEHRAREACRRLKKMRQACLVVPPQAASLAGNQVN